MLFTTNFNQFKDVLGPQFYSSWYASNMYPNWVQGDLNFTDY